MWRGSVFDFLIFFQKKVLTSDFRPSSQLGELCGSFDYTTPKVYQYSFFSPCRDPERSLPFCIRPYSAVCIVGLLRLLRGRFDAEEARQKAAFFCFWLSSCRSTILAQLVWFPTSSRLAIRVERGKIESRLWVDILSVTSVPLTTCNDLASLRRILRHAPPQTQHIKVCSQNTNRDT